MCVCIFYYIHRTHVYSFCVKNCASPVLPKSQFPIDTWAGHCGFRRRTTDAADALLAPPAPAATGKPAARAPHPGFSVTDRTVPQTVAPPVTLNATVHRRWAGPRAHSDSTASPPRRSLHHAAVFPRVASYPSTPPSPCPVHPAHVHPAHPNAHARLTGPCTGSTRGPSRSPTRGVAPPPRPFRPPRARPVPLHPPHEPVASIHRQLHLAIRVTRPWSIRRVHAEVSRAAPGTPPHYPPTGHRDRSRHTSSYPSRHPPRLPGRGCCCCCCYPQSHSPHHRPRHRNSNRRGRVDRR